MSQHLMIAPILLPLLTGALMLLYDDRQREAKFWLSMASALLQLLVAIQLLVRAKIGGDGGGTNSPSTCWATGRPRSASCWWSTGLPQ